MDVFDILDENNDLWEHAAVLACEPQHFDDMDDLVGYTLRRDGVLSARKVA